MAKLLSDSQYAVRGRLVGIDNSGLVGPPHMDRGAVGVRMHG